MGPLTKRFIAASLTPLIGRRIIAFTNARQHEGTLEEVGDESFRLRTSLQGWQRIIYSALITQWEPGMTELDWIQLPRGTYRRLCRGIYVMEIIEDPPEDVL